MHCTSTAWPILCQLPVYSVVKANLWTIKGARQPGYILVVTFWIDFPQMHASLDLTMREHLFKKSVVQYILYVVVSLMHSHLISNPLQCKCCCVLILFPFFSYAHFICLSHFCHWNHHVLRDYWNHQRIIYFSFSSDTISKSTKPELNEFEASSRTVGVNLLLRFPIWVLPNFDFWVWRCRQ